MRAGRVVSILWSHLTWRHWRRSPRSTAILLFILALGVGVFFSIRLANRAAVAGFEMFTETVTGASDLVVIPVAGEFSNSVLAELRALSGDLPVNLFPVIETTATDHDIQSVDSDGFSAEQFRVVGLDLLALPNLIYLSDSNYQPPVGAIGDGRNRDSAVFVNPGLAAERELKAGSQFSVTIDDRVVNLEVAGILPERDLQVSYPRDLLLADLPLVQRLCSRHGKIDRVEVRLPPGSLTEVWTSEIARRLEEGSRGRWELITPENRRNTGADMTRALRLNLTILSLLALLVGIYLILQALEASVVKRREEIGVLRSLGVTPFEIRCAWLFEAVVLGFVGSLAGLGLGWLGAQFSVRAVARTVNSLYYSNTTEAAAFDLGEAGAALALGMIASVVAGWLPARDASATPPSEVLQRGTRGGGIELLRRPAFGALLLVAGGAAAMLPPWIPDGGGAIPLGGYFAAALFVIGGSTVAGWFFPFLAATLKRVGNRSAVWRYAFSQFRKPTGRHRLATAGLVIAMGMAAGMSILVASFEFTVTQWIGQILKADLFVAPAGVANASNRNRILAPSWRALASAPGVEDFEIGQMHRIRFEGSETMLVGGNLGASTGWRNFVWQKRPRLSLDDFSGAGPGEPLPVLVNETFTHRFHRAVGDEMQLPTPSGPQRVAIAGVFADYGNERGAVVASWDRVSRWFDSDHVSSLAVYLADGNEAESIRRRWQGEFPGLVIRTNRHLRAEVVRIFNQTFLVTHVLKWIGVAVAVAGQALALVSILMERRRELVILKEVGMSRRGIARSVAAEGTGLGIAGATVGAGLSVALGLLLIKVINLQSFGWTLAVQIPVLELLALAGAVVGTSWVVGWLTGWWGARLPSEREE